MLGHLNSIPTIVGVVRADVKVTVGLPRGLYTEARNVLGGNEQPVPVDVLRHVVAGVTQRTLAERAVVRVRRNSAKQVPRDVFGAVRERNLGTVVTVQRVAPNTAGATITLLILAEGAVELQCVVIVRTNRRHDSLSDPAVLAELAGHRILLGVRGHLALDPVLQRSFVVTRPLTAGTLADFVDAEVCRRLSHDLVDRVIRQVGTVNLQTLSCDVAAVEGVHQVPSECTLRVILLPEGLALHLATLARRLHRVLNSLVLLVHDIILRLLTVEETDVVHAVRSDFPTCGCTLRIERVGLRTEEAVVVSVDLLECFAVRVLSPDTDLLILRLVRVSVKLVLPTERIEERTHLDRVASIRTGHRGVGRRGVAILVYPLGVHAHALHRNWTVVFRIRVDRHIAVTGVQHEALDGLSVALRGARLNRASILLRRLKGIAFLPDRSLVNAVGIHTRVHIASLIRVRFSLLIWRRSRCRDSVIWSNRMDERSYHCNRESGGSDSGAATASYAVKTLHFHEKSFLIKN